MCSTCVKMNDRKGIGKARAKVNERSKNESKERKNKAERIGEAKKRIAFAGRMLVSWLYNTTEYCLSILITN